MEVARVHYRGFILLVAIWAMVTCAPATAGPAPAPAKPGQFYTSFGWGAYRGDGAGFSYGGNPAGTGFAFDYDPPVSGVSTELTLGYVLPEATPRPVWLGENLRVELQLGYVDAGWSVNGRPPTGIKVPFLDHRPPNLYILAAPIPYDQSSFSQELNYRSYELLLATDYRLPKGSLTVTPFLGVNRYMRQETSNLTLVDPNLGTTDMTLSERLNADYIGLHAGAAVVAPLRSGWRVLAGASRSWLRTDAELDAQQVFPTYPTPPGTAMQLGNTDNRRSAQRTTYLLGIGHDSGWARADLILERNSWSYIPTVVNPMLYTGPSAYLDSGHATDTALRLMFTVPFGR